MGYQTQVVHTQKVEMKQEQVTQLAEQQTEQWEQEVATQLATAAATQAAHMASQLVVHLAWGLIENTHKVVGQAQTQCSGPLVVAAGKQVAIAARTQRAVGQANCSQLAWQLGHHSRGRKSVGLLVHSQRTSYLMCYSWNS